MLLGIKQSTIPDMAFNLHVGEQLSCIDGLHLNTKPIGIQVVDEYPYFYVVYIQFREKSRGSLSRGYTTAVNKADIYSRNIICRKTNGELVCAYD